MCVFARYQISDCGAEHILVAPLTGGGDGGKMCPEAVFDVTPITSASANNALTALQVECGSLADAPDVVLDHLLVTFTDQNVIRVSKVLRGAPHLQSVYDTLTISDSPKWV